ncbi:hypothetical protein [Microvirga zambiensis]|uniref:hypothetical protein n=1 Tax=Microvirga zambiensis TaxID=1402137 RepID=UPI00191F49B6|nr:hypothetical protein [Microvirga zambiensis]
MSGKDHLLRLAAIFGHQSGLPQTTVSWRLFQDTNKLEGIERGRDLYLGRFERAVRYLSDNWPAGAEWPADIPRPPSSHTGEAA